ncbi:orotate phosphoribosyltransferase [Pedomonas sp. V897]|uniref:orotate phosphoribosyltransferase n=1 Tax=Pedomonas sp. V897 TaxID=3446482 RepID=UPI003EDF806B
MTNDEVLAEFRAAGALLEGHFILSSGLRSPMYLQCALVLKNPRRAEKLCKALAAAIPAEIRDQIDLVVSPAMGGVVVGYEMARALGVEGIFTERVEGQFQLRRGFEIPAGARVFMMEDVVTTGLSSRECIATIEANGGRVVAAGALVDRSNGKVDLGVPFFPLIRLDVPTYQPDQLPPELAAIPAIKPGSRGLKA